MPKLRYYRRLPRRWGRRTGWVLAQMQADFGLRGATSGGPAWLRDNPFLLKTSRTETRRFGLILRLGMAALILSGVLVGGLWLRGKDLDAPVQFPFLLGGSYSSTIFAVMLFVHTVLISNARTALGVSLGDEMRRGTLPDLLLTPLRRAEMLVAMGIGPARGALLVAWVGLPIYLILAQLGGLSGQDLVMVYVLLALLSYAPPVYALPALSGAALTPDNPLTAKAAFTSLSKRRGPRFGNLPSAWVWIFLTLLFLGQVISQVGGVWLPHLLQALGMDSSPPGSVGGILLWITWPYYAVQILGERLEFFGWELSPLCVVLPIMALRWAANALTSAAALSAGSLEEMRRLPLASRAQTLTRWTARATGFCVVGFVWKPWVESGDTASLATNVASGPAWNVAGLALLLGGLTTYNVLGRALAVPVRTSDGSVLRPYGKTLRRALKQCLRPLTVAGVTLLLACALGGVSPFAVPLYRAAGRIVLVALSAVFWAIGLRRVLPRQMPGRLVPNVLLYALPVAALSLPIPGLWTLAALSPVSAWLSLFAGVPLLLSRSHSGWPLGHLPSFEICVVETTLTGLLLASLSSVKTRSAQRPALKATPRKQPVKVRNAILTARLLAWVTAHTDNPLFTQEIRARTRSGRWADWRYLAPGVFLAVALLTLTYPDFVDGLTEISPFRRIDSFSLSNYAFWTAPLGIVWAHLNSLLLAVQVYAIGFRGQGVGETLIARDRQRGLWGFILLTPLTMRQIFWGKLFGQTSGAVAAWAVCSLASLLLTLFAAPTIGVGLALATWLSGQIFIAALYILGVSLGTALATFPLVLKALRGFSTLLFVCVVIGGVDLILTNFSDTDITYQLLLGSVYGLVIAVPALIFAQWRISRLRQRDIVFGDGVE